MRFGTMTDSTNYLFQRKYDNLSVRVLKKRLHSLKRNATPNSSTEKRYVSSLICKKLINNVTNNNNGPVVWYQKDIRSKFWTTCHKLFASALNAIPTFDISKCYDYFKATLSITNVNRSFKDVSWMPRLAHPTQAYNASPPSYSDVARALNKCKAKASACPFDQLSIVILKRCPILRTLFHCELLVNTNYTLMLETWRYNSDPGNLSNFRPITITR